MPGSEAAGKKERGFPPYDAVNLVRDAILEEYPELTDVLPLPERGLAP